MILSFLALCPFFCLAQKVSLYVGNNLVEIPAQQTQSELKPGWKIVDIQMKPKKTCYLWGEHSKQMTDDQRPVFVIEPGEGETLADYAFIKLKKHKQYRQIKEDILVNNPYIRIDLNSFNINPEGDKGFVVQPKDAMEKGEFILVNLLQKPIGKLGDYNVFPIQIP
ncbi:MAG: hypothetical protein J6X23_01570 [Bacteroidaceae bacterium]|nr:hypothetical protein [Bacteroidaceae bacterium]